MNVIASTVLDSRTASQRYSDGLHKQITNVALIWVPFAGTIYALHYFWSHRLTIVDISSFILFYVLGGFGVGIGLHRYFTHGSFRAPNALRWILAFLGSITFQGTIIRWVADHRRHHQFADQDGDLHSPHRYAGDGMLVRIRNLLHAHILWTLDPDTTDYSKYAPDLLMDPVALFFQRYYWPVALLSWLFSALYGFAWTRSAQGAFESLLMGGFVRTTLLHNAIFIVNSFGHRYGGQPESCSDQSRNSPVWAFFTFGEGWHNNHHAHPSAALNTIRPWEFDLNGLIILGLERLGLVSHVIRRKSSSPEPSSANK